VNTAVEGRDRLADTMLRDEMRRLNTHLPRKRQTISELLKEETPSVLSVDGNKIIMKKTELESFAKKVADDFHDRVKLPLVLLRRTELGPGAFTLLGDSVEEFALFTLATDSKVTLEEFRKTHTTPTIFYKPQVSELLRMFHTLIVIGFGVPEDLYR
jgi:uncharacterized protein (UPF0216 family)